MLGGGGGLIVSVARAEWLSPCDTADRTAQYEGPGVELGFPPLDHSDALLPLQLQRRYTAVCLALKHTLRYAQANPIGGDSPLTL